MVRLGQDHQTRVRVKVDESGAHDLVSRVDSSGSFDVAHVAPQHLHRFAVDAHGGPEADVARAIHHLTAGDQHVEHVGSNATIRDYEAQAARRDAGYQ